MLERPAILVVTGIQGAGVGLWVDSTRQSPQETVEEIVERIWAEGLIESL